MTVKLEGGLGNQIFQLSAGYFLAAKLLVDLKIDQYSIPLSTAHGERECGFFPFKSLKLPGDSQVFFDSNLPNRCVALLSEYSIGFKKVILKVHNMRIQESDFPVFIESNDLNDQDTFFKIDKPVKLFGNFQSWNIVEQSAQNGFPRKLELRLIPTWIKDLSKSIDFGNSVVMHLRMGDDAQKNTFFSQPGIGYYRRALEIFSEEKGFDRVFVVSDDMIRAREVLNTKEFSRVEFLDFPNYALPAEKMYLLSLFAGIVCANSTFCGWAAWGIHNSGGQVVVPVPYSDGSSLGSRDFPDSWIKLDKKLP